MSTSELSSQELNELFDFISQKLGENPCDARLIHAQVWADSKGKNWLTVKAFLEANGGYCDCEVLMNVDIDEAVQG